MWCSLWWRQLCTLLSSLLHSVEWTDCPSTETVSPWTRGWCVWRTSPTLLIYFLLFSLLFFHNIFSSSLKRKCLGAEHATIVNVAVMLRNEGRAVRHLRQVAAVAAVGAVRLHLLVLHRQVGDAVRRAALVLQALLGVAQVQVHARHHHHRVVVIIVIIVAVLNGVSAVVIVMVEEVTVAQDMEGGVVGGEEVTDMVVIAVEEATVTMVMMDMAGGNQSLST